MNGEEKIWVALSFSHAYPQLSSSLPTFPLLDLCPRPIFTSLIRRQAEIRSGYLELSIRGAPYNSSWRGAGVMAGTSVIENLPMSGSGVLLGFSKTWDPILPSKDSGVTGDLHSLGIIRAITLLWCFSICKGFSRTLFHLTLTSISGSRNIQPHFTSKKINLSKVTQIEEFRIQFS